ncbi:MAG: hypothetical protein RL559_506 [Pseudomonadota bacterium]
MKPTALHRRHWPWAIALVLAWQLWIGWGQVHRVLHLGAPAFSSASAKADAPAWGDEHGSGLCQLLDQLSLGGGLARAAPQALAHAEPPAPAQAPRWVAVALDTAVFEARGPPLSR